ncbi:DUF4124 domain-containing protein, partial [bacterium AH-315-I11]|nr:DUF4124 domain-containing protein [bacterium AH-315-I11]
MNRQRLNFVAFLLICVVGFWYLKGQLTPERPDVTPYAARPELLDDAPVLLAAIETETAESQGIDIFALRQTAQERMEAASALGIMESAPDFSCNMAPIREVTTARSNQIYQWRDENGQLHFSDSPPAGVSTEVFDARQGATVEYFQLDIDFRGANAVPFFRNQIQSQANSMYEILAGMVGEERLKQVDLNVVIFPDWSSYLEYATAIGGETMVNSGGFYTNASNEAVTYIYEDDEQTLAVSRHEATHVILNGMLAAGPLWLHEGMAEYFELLSIRQQYTQIRPNAEWLDLARSSLANGYPASLVDYLDAPPEEWRGKAQAMNYALGWSLVYFLLDSNDGQRALSALLQKLADDYCTLT